MGRAEARMNKKSYTTRKTLSRIKRVIQKIINRLKIMDHRRNCTLSPFFSHFQYHTHTFYYFCNDVKDKFFADCVFMTSQAGRYVYEAIDSTETVCGIYVFTDPDEIVEVSFPRIDVPCGGKDLVVVSLYIVLYIYIYM